MNTEERIQMQIMDFLAGDLDATQEEQLRTDMKELALGTPEEWSSFYTMIEEIPTPTPSDHMDSRFFEQLAKEANTQENVSFELGNVFAWFGITWKPQYSTFGFLILLGLVFGYALGIYSNPYSDKVDILVGEVQEMKQDMLLTLIEKESAMDRLKAVNISQQIPSANNKIIEALLKTLNEDEDQNVRLASIEALLRYTDNPLVRTGLIESIGKQESPLVQVTLAEVMVILSEKRSVGQLKELLKKEKLDTTVRTKVEESIEILM